LKGVPPCCARANVAGEASCRCSPANAGEALVVRSIQSAGDVLRCWPIRTRRLRTQGHQRTNMTDVPFWDAKVLGCVPVVYCAANLRGLASLFAHDWATASLLHVSTSAVVHSPLRVVRTAKEPASMRWPAVLVVCGDCCRDDRQRAPNPQSQTFAHTVAASLGSATAQHTHHQLSNVIDRRTLETQAVGLAGCVVVRLFGGANSLQCHQHAQFLEFRAQNLHRIHRRSWQCRRHPTVRERANDVSYFAP
jgi:hypothetical protein